MKDRLVFVKTKKHSVGSLCGGCHLNGDFCNFIKSGSCDTDKIYKLVEQIEEIQSEYEWKKERYSLIKHNGTLESKELNIWLEENKPERWVTCTKENTQVGDEVRYKPNSKLFRKVDFIFDDGRLIVLTNFETGLQQTNVMSDYEINPYGKDKE